MTHPLSERQQLKLLLQTTAPSADPSISALSTPISPTHYLSWSSARRRAWDRRHSFANNYFLHYLHPTLTPRLTKWSVEEHHVFLAALRHAPPCDRWGLFSLLVPGRIGSDCKRYYHRIGRAGYITVDGQVRRRLVSKAKVMDGKRAVESTNALFLRRSLRKFIPKELPKIDDTLYRSLEKSSSNRSTANKLSANRTLPEGGKRKGVGNNRGIKAKAVSAPKAQSLTRTLSPTKSSLPAQPLLMDEAAQDMLTYIPAKPSEYDGEPPSDKNQHVSLDVNKKSATKLRETGEPIPCRLRMRQSDEKKHPVSSIRSQKPRVRPNSNVGCASQPTVPKYGRSNVKNDTVKIKIRTKSLEPRLFPAKDSKCTPTPRYKCKEVGRNGKLKTSAHKSVNGEEKDNENVNGFQPRPSQSLVQSKKPVRAAKDSDVSGASENQSDAEIDKQADAVGPPPLVCTNGDGGHLEKERKSVQPLKPILRTKEHYRKRFEKTKTVHFSQIETLSRKAPNLKKAVQNEDVIPERKSPCQLDLGFKSGNAAPGHTSWDGKLSSTHEICQEEDKTDDASRRTWGTSESENNPSSTCPAQSSDHVIKSHVPAKSSMPVSCNVNTEHIGRLSKDDKENREGNLSLSQTVSATFGMKETAIEVQAIAGDMSSADECVTSSNSDERCGNSEHFEQPTSQPLHVGSFAPMSKNSCFDRKEEKLGKPVEIVPLEQSTSGGESDSTGMGTDGELLDMLPVVDSPPKSQSEMYASLEEEGEHGEQIKNLRRVTGPTKGDRASISFLMNSEVAEPEHKRQKMEDSASGADIYGRFERAVSLIGSDRDIISATQEEVCEENVKENDPAFSSSVSQRSEPNYEVMQKRIQQTHLMLQLFVGLVDPIGEQLGHKRQRAKLMESFEESLTLLRDTEGHAAKKRPLGISNFADIAKTAVEIDGLGRAGKHCTVHVGGLTAYWGSFVEDYLQRVDEMEIRQKMEVDARRSVDSVI